MANPAHVYAAAFYDVAKKENQAESALLSLREFSDLCAANLVLKAVLMGDGVDSRSRGAILKDILSAAKIQGVAARLLSLLVARGRASILGDIIREIEALGDAEKGIKSGLVKTAVELGAEEIDSLGNTLAKRVGGKVRLRAEVDPALLGGFVATVAGKTYDASLRSQMERIRSELI